MNGREDKPGGSFEIKKLVCQLYRQLYVHATSNSDGNAIALCYWTNFPSQLNPAQLLDLQV